MCFYALRLTRARDHTRALIHTQIQSETLADKILHHTPKNAQVLVRTKTVYCFFYMQKLLCANVFTCFLHINLLYAKKCAQEASRQDALTHTQKHTHTRNLLQKMFLRRTTFQHTICCRNFHTHFFTNRCFHTHKLWHTGVFTRGPLHTDNLNAGSFTHRSSYAKQFFTHRTLSHRTTLTHRCYQMFVFFYAHAHIFKNTSRPQILTIDARFVQVFISILLTWMCDFGWHGFCAQKDLPAQVPNYHQFWTIDAYSVWERFFWRKFRRCKRIGLFAVVDV